MGIFGRKRAAKAEAAAAVEAWTAEVSAALPAAQVSAESWTPPFGRGLTATSYTVTVPGSRSQLAAVVGRLAAQIEALGEADTLHLQITGAEAPGTVSPPLVSSTLVLSGQKRSRNWMQTLLRTYDSLAARFPGTSVLIGGLNNRCTLLDVARADAVNTGRELISWWQEQRAGEPEPGALSGVSLEIGGGPDDPEISYTVDLTPPEDLDELDDEDEDTGGAVNAVGAMGAGTAEAPRQQIRRAAAAWTAGLDDLDAATRLTVRPGHALEFSFRLPSFEPHLAVVERDTGVWNEKEAAAVAAEIRLRYPASGIRI